MLRGLWRAASYKTGITLALGLALAGCPQPRLDSPNHFERLAAIKDSGDEAALENIAVSAKSKDEAVAAVNQIRTQERLARIAINAKGIINPASQAAIKKINNPDILVALLTGQYGVNEHLSLDAVSQLTSPERLAQVVMNAPQQHSLQASYALDRLAEEQTVLQIAASHPQEAWRKRAEVRVEKIRTDRRLAALNESTDQRFFRDVALNDADRSIRFKAVERLNDPAFLTEVAIAADSQSEFIGVKAVEKITDQSLLADIAVQAAHWKPAHAAVEKVKAPALLEQVVRHENASPRVALKAAEKISAPATLNALAVSSKHRDVRILAVNKINDQPTLAAAAKDDTEETVRIAALKRLSHQPTLEILAQDKKRAKWERTIAISRLENIQLLRKISKANMPSYNTGIFGTGSFYALEKQYYYYGVEGPVAALRLALLETGLPAPMTLLRKETSSSYKKIGSKNPTKTGIRHGETITISIPNPANGGATEKTFKSVFPTRVGRPEGPFIFARVPARDIRDMLKEYLQAAASERAQITFATAAASPMLRVAALSSLNREDLTLAAARDDNLFIKLFAISGLSNQAALAEIARQSDIRIVGEAAVKRLNNADLLRAIVKDPKMSHLRESASSRLWDVQQKR